MHTIVGALKTAAGKRGLTLEEYIAKLDAGEKWCTWGKHWKLKVEFPPDSSRSDKLSCSCAGCHARIRPLRTTLELRKPGKVHFVQAIASQQKSS